MNLGFISDNTSPSSSINPFMNRVINANVLRFHWKEHDQEAGTKKVEKMRY